MDASFEEVVTSYHRARQASGFFDSFYRIFLEESPEIPPMFARTDFPHQKLMLRESILEMLLFAQTGAGRAEIERLGAHHRQLHVTNRHYDLWLDALCKALAKHDAHFDEALAQKWRKVLGLGISVMANLPDAE